MLCVVVFDLRIDANLKCCGSREKEVQKKANQPSGEQSRTLCVFFELKGDQLLIFPGGTSVIRHATHGVIYASRSYEREHSHWTRITRFDPLLPHFLLVLVSAFSVDIHAVATLCLYIFRELSHSSCAEPEKSNEALVEFTNVYYARDPWRTRYVNLSDGTRGIIHGITSRVVRCAFFLRLLGIKEQGERWISYTLRLSPL